eukprot:CAMPEP_0172317146 /NCGR_PEP_ID=MMETSP1058-20130122/30651_1 /TAXON_ID=83371 /ORGANISM="Detonula confervacea, Strain CCMP 353" /LENGTH=1163 /DNA_ID=CAMNT_0013031633 /DNA_START=128 /DNA_END=3619 /DNA_ORIENTATION=-
MSQNDDHEDDSLSTSSSTASNHSQTPASDTLSSPLAMSTSHGITASPSPPKIILSSSQPSRVLSSSPRRVARAVPNHTPATAVRIAIDMRTRSSRLFFVLLHLVGVSTNVPSGRTNSSPSNTNSNNSPFDIFSFVRQHHPTWLTWSVGIVGVHPTAILLERLHVESSRRGLKGILERVERVWGWDGNIDLLGEPYWFQDNGDGQCLGPGGGFSECGDATLWRVRRRPLTKRQLREKRYKMRHRQRLQDKREKVDVQEQNEKTTEKQQTDHQGSSSTSSSVCVWPFFCEQDSQFLQSTQTDYDEVYGFEYENFDQEEEGFALQLMDVDAMITANSSVKMAEGLTEGRRRHKRRLFWNFNNNQEADDEDECLLSFPSTKNGSGSTTLQIGSCSSEEAWVWHVNRDGILVRGSTNAEKRRRKRGRWRITSPRRASAAAASDGNSGRLLHSSQADFGCVHRVNSTLAMMLPCDGDVKQQGEEDASLVGFSLVRFPSPSSKSAARRQVDGTNDADPSWEPWTTLEGPATASVDDKSQIPATNAEDMEAGSKVSEQHLPTSRTSSQNHASAGAKHRKVDLKSTASMLHTGLEQGGKAGKDAATSASHIRDAPIAMNGVSFHKQRMNKAGEKSDSGPKGPSTTKLRLNKKPKEGRKNARARGQTPIHDDSSETRGGDHGPDSNPHPPRKIPVHPYIQSSKDFVWVDPLTSLEYPTDLCRYLGHTKKEAGRHTLMGVGQYYRTAFNIKVYGAALYVAKRDVLADPKFGDYATLSSEDLRSRGDFYEHLMNIPSPGEDPADSIGGFFDRTLFIKINMQLSTDAMRKSLEADWSLLTDEMKTLIIDSSFEERMADERMQKKIQSKENSSNCSCGQSAPEGITADPSCCARGTELVFTWRKNGDFEVRLDGRLMDIFPRPDIAKGIFSEYLNDSPISQDAKSHFADGFPFLLAPLAQVKGMSSAVPQSHEPPKKLKSPSSHNPMHRLMDAAVNSVGAMNTQAHTVSKWMQDGAAEMSSSALGSAVGVARGLSEELDKQRMELLENAVAFQKEGMEMLSSLIKLSKENDGSALTIVNDAMPSLSPFSNGFETYNQDEGFSPEIMPDEIGIKIEPTMNFTHTLFFTTVHIYLLLLLVVSIPGSNNTRLVVKRRILETKKFVQSQSHGAFAAMSKLH